MIVIFLCLQVFQAQLVSLVLRVRLVVLAFQVPKVQQARQVQVASQVIYFY